MTKRTNYQLPIIVALAIIMLFATSCTNNWPQFRGADQNPVVNNNQLPLTWAENSNVAWTYKLNGISWSSPIIWGDKVFVSTDYRVEEIKSTGDEDLGALDDIYRWELSCISLKTGKEIWKKVAYEGNPKVKTHAGNSYASETPVTDGKRVYVYYGMTGVFCFDMDGNALWNKDLGAYQTLRDWGTGSSPVLQDEVLYVQVDNEEQSFLVALDAKTGHELWKVMRNEKTNYSTPFIWKNKMRTELITSGDSARSYDLKTGTLLWSLKLGGERSISSPVADNELLYIGNAGGRRAPGTLFAVKASASGNITPAEGELTSDGVKWSIPEAGTGNPSPLLFKGLIYILSSRGGEVECIDASNGEIVYQEKLENVGACWSSPWLNNDKVYITDERGTTHIFKEGRKFESLPANNLEDKIWASPAIANDAYVMKGAEKLYCIKNVRQN